MIYIYKVAKNNFYDFYIVIMYYDLTKTAKLPLRVIKGTAKQRDAMSEKLFFDFCKNISLHIGNNDRLSVSVIKDCFQNTLPTKIGLQISGVGKIFNEKSCIYDGYTGYMVRGKNRKVVGYNVFCPLDESKKNLELKYLDVLFHEIRHVYDFITNPKSLVRGFFVPKRLQNFYDEKIYPKDAIKLDKLEQRISNQIKRFPYYKRIDFLQEVRSSLQSEINAYNCELVYPIFATMHPQHMPMKNIGDGVEYYNFQEKLTICEKLLKKELLAVRAENKQLFGNK